MADPRFNTGDRVMDAALAADDRKLESMGYYDETCDMAASDLARPPFADAPNVLEENEMREAGFEPARLSTPDPKSRRDRQTPDSTGSLNEAGATERQPATPDIAESTTDSATDEDGGSEAEPSSRLTRPVPIFARTPETKCASCGAVGYWSIEEFSGLNVLVSIEGPSSVAPDRYNQGVGVIHVCPPRAETTRQRVESPL